MASAVSSSGNVSPNSLADINPLQILLLLIFDIEISTDLTFPPKMILTPFMKVTLLPFISLQK